MSLQSLLSLQSFGFSYRKNSPGRVRNKRK
jgi:hypothetical protein